MRESLLVWFFFGRQVTDRFFFFFGFESFTTDRIGSTPTRIALIASTRLESIQSDEWIALKMVSESTLKVQGDRMNDLANRISFLFQKETEWYRTVQ